MKAARIGRRFVPSATIQQRMDRQDARYARPNKYGAVKVTEDGFVFDSKREHARYRELTLLEKAGEITRLELQPAFPIHGADGTRVALYRADFQYLIVANGEVVVEDVKSPATRLNRSYRLKKKLVEAEHGISIIEI